MRFSRQFLLSLFVAVIFANAVYSAKDWPYQARLFPWVIGIPMFFLALIQVTSDLRGPNEPGREAAVPGIDEESTPSVEISPEVARRRMINIFAWIFGFLGLVWLLGFQISVPLLVFLYLKVQSQERWGLSLVHAGVAWVFLWGIFDRFLHLPFPESAVLGWLKSLGG
ncbi:MAG: tripartite tricarboxylate transporter TctB family protein [Candidatus Binatia bacterium]